MTNDDGRDTFVNAPPAAISRRRLLQSAAGVAIAGAVGGSRPRPAAAVPTIYYVKPTGDDSREGWSEETAWATAYRAARQPLEPGDVVLFEDGVYQERQQFRPVAGGTAEGGHVTFKARNTGKATLHYGNSLPNQAKLEWTVPYVWIEGLNVTQTTKGTTPGDRPVSPWIGADSFVLKDLEIWNAMEPIKCLQNDNGLILNCVCRRATWGLGLFNCRFTKIIGCHFYDFDADAIQTKGNSRSIRVHGNLVRATLASPDRNTGITLGGNSVGTPGEGVTDRRGHEAWNVVASGNIVMTEGPGRLPHAFLIHGAKDCLVLNNTVVGPRIDNAFSCQHGAGDDWLARPRTVNPRFVNNVVAGARVGFSAEAGLDYDGALEDAYNTMHEVGATIDAGTTIAKLTSDPLFVNRRATFADSDLRLRRGSPSRESGATATFLGYYGQPFRIDFDYDREPRAEPWDRGAYEGA